MGAPRTGGGPRAAGWLTVLLCCALAACRGGAGGDDKGGAGASPAGDDGAGGPEGTPELVRPSRDGYVHDLFVITGSAPGRSFRVRLGDGVEPQLLGASEATFYDGTALARFGRLALERDEALAGGGRYRETRVRLWEEDGLGTGRWVHNHGTFQDPQADLGEDCDPSSDACLWSERSGMDLVAIVGSLRGIRRWSGGQAGPSAGWSKTRYRIHDRFGNNQEFLRLWGPQHKELVREARAIFDALPEDTRSCYAFDYQASYLRPAPGGLVWVMHATPRYQECQGTVIPIEVATPPPRHGAVDVTALGEPGEVFHFGPPDVWVEPDRERAGAAAGQRPFVVRTADATVELPGGSDEDPPLGAIHWMPEASIPPEHVAALELAYTEVHDLTPSPGPAPVVDGRLGEWDGARMLLLDARTNLDWLRYDTPWDGPADASLAVGVRRADDGWVVAARIADDTRVLAGPGIRPRAVDHLRVWVLGHDGWIRLRIEASAEPGDVPVTVERTAGADGHERDSTPAEVERFADVRAAATPYEGGMDVELRLPDDALRLDEGRVGLRVLYADADGGSPLEGDALIGTTAERVDAWLVP